MIKINTRVNITNFLGELMLYQLNDSAKTLNDVFVTL